MHKTASVEDFQLISSFQTLREVLLEDRYADRMEKPLAFWALPNDRRLPMAFLGRTLKELLSTPFEDLSATPGIGQKKINSLVKLLSRATKDQPPSVPFTLMDSIEKRPVSGEDGHFLPGHFDPSVVSEVLWLQWCETVRSHEAGREMLGRLAPSLQALPTVIWRTPLDTYLDHTLAEIRQMKTHGQKRVRVILEVFHTVHQTLSHAPAESHLAFRLMPKFVGPIEHWIHSALSRTSLPTLAEIREHLVVPLVSQLKLDAGSTVSALAESRLGLSEGPQSVRQQSKKIGVTRARIYQLLEDCSKVMDVRWPEGKTLLEALTQKITSSNADQDFGLLYATIELFYPSQTLSELNDRDA